MDLPPSDIVLSELTALFYETPQTLARFSPVRPDEVPDDYRRLLVHQEHMTVAIEAFHESLVRVEVLATRITPTRYARQILLRRQTDDRVVQFGIMRVTLACLTPPIRAEIEAQHRPLGRILVRHNVLRTIHLHALWRVEPGDALRRHFNLPRGTITYGRTAGIDLEGVPAVEVLEIAAPL